jgi:hypothetical protein
VDSDNDQTPQHSELDGYIGRKPAYSNELGAEIFARIDRWKTTIENNGLSRQWRQNYRLYHNADPSGTAFGDDAFSITGDQNEMMTVRFNEFRNLLTHILNMTVSQKVALQTKAANSEPESLSQAQLWDGVIDYYLSQWRRSRSQKQLRKAVELSLIMSNGYVLVEWDAAKGEPFVADQNGAMIRKGDVSVKCRSVLDVVFDTNVEDEDELDWVIVRDFQNRYELMARYPDKAEEIKSLESKTEADMSGTQWGWDGETDLVPVYKFFHRSTVVLPRGRVVFSLSPDCILLDQDNPYTDENNEAVIPLLTIRAADGLGSLFGYSPGNDLAPIQQAMNMVWSSIITNEAVNGVGNISVERGSGIAVQTMGGGVNVIEREPGTAPPEALTLSSNQRQSADVLSLVRGQGERISAINSAARGEIDSATKAASGRALGLLQAMSVQFHSSLQFSFQQLTQDFGNLLLLIVKRFAQTEQVISIVGEDEAARQVTFTGESFSQVARVVCEPVNPLSKTLAGNKEEAEFMVQNGVISTPQQYITVRNTGRLEPLFRSEWSLNKLIDQENEMMMKGTNPPVLMTDDHELHVKEHLVLLNSPQVRMTGSILEVVLQHVQQHKDIAAQMMPQEPMMPPEQGGGQPQQQEQPQGGGEQSVMTPSGQELPLPDTAAISDNLAQVGGTMS